MHHPSYLPDLAPSDFWLFDLIKKNLDDHYDVESQNTLITKLLQSIPKEQYKNIGQVVRADATLYRQ